MEGQNTFPQQNHSGKNYDEVYEYQYMYLSTLFPYICETHSRFLLLPVLLRHETVEYLLVYWLYMMMQERDRTPSLQFPR